MLSFTYYIAVLCWRCPHWLWETGRCTQHSAEMLPWGGPVICITRSMQLSTLLRSTGFTSPQRRLYSLWFESKCGYFCAFWQTLWKPCVSPGTGLLWAWLPGSLALREDLSYCSNLITGDNVFWVTQLGGWWDHSTGAQIGAFWQSGVTLKPLKPGWGWDRVEPSHVQKWLPGRETCGITNA